jgi:hypothetical protein
MLHLSILFANPRRLAFFGILTPSIIFASMLCAFLAANANAAPVTDVIPGARGGGAAQTVFSSQTNDVGPLFSRFLGAVDSSTESGVTIRTGVAVDTQFDLTDAGMKRPPLNSVTGRNVEGGGYNFTGDTELNSWEYFVQANPGEWLTSIDYSGDLWYAGGVNGNDILHFELFTNGELQSSAARSAMTEATSGNGKQETDSMTNLLTNSGGPGVTTATVRIYLDVEGPAFSSGGESFWTNGTLSAQSVPEPSAVVLLGLAGIAVGIEARRQLALQIQEQ